VSLQILYEELAINQAAGFLSDDPEGLAGFLNAAELEYTPPVIQLRENSANPQGIMLIHGDPTPPRARRIFSK
jgi:hypothetical protein